MGSSVGTYDDNEVANLSDQARADLKQQAVRHLLDSPEVRAIIEQHPEILANDRRINKVLREKLDPVLARHKTR
jgi:hypothetical protein